MNEKGTYDVIVIGGGAAGLTAAVAAAWKARYVNAQRPSSQQSNPQQPNHPPIRVGVFEADDRVGRSILATGNGRCNFSNSTIDGKLYHNAAFVEKALASLEQTAFWPRCDDGATPVRADESDGGAGNAVLDFFFDIGLCWREEGQGRLFPVTGKASTVLDVLRAAARALGVEECCTMRVCSLELPRAPGKPYTLRMADGAFQRACAVVCAVGGAVAQDFLPSNLAFCEVHPVLGPLKTDTRFTRALDNIRVRGTAALERAGAVVAVERGEVLFRKYGLSGIAIFNLSRFAQPGDAVVLDLVPDMQQEQLCAFLVQRAHLIAQLQGAGLRKQQSSHVVSHARNPVQKADNANPTCDDVLRGLFLPLVAEAVLKRAGLKPSDAANSENLRQVAQAAKRFSVTVEGVGDAKQCQVHRGGFSCDEFNPTTMESKRFAKLFAAGEMLDVDAPCGGYNLHWAWASGLLAGASAAASLEDQGRVR